jgi:flagellin-like protein
MWPRVDDNRGATPIIGNILLVAVIIVLATVITVVSFTFLEDTGTPSADASFEYEQSPVGLRMTPVALGTDVIVQLNGKPIETISADAAGESVLIPTAPDDMITVVSRDEQQSVLIQREIDDRNEIGDFISYYTFEEGSGTTVTDASGNGNDGEMYGGVSRTDASCGSALDFDGSSGTYVDIGDLSADGTASVEELTIAIQYVHYGGSDIQNLIEHQDSSFAWYMETDGKHGDPHQMEFNIGYSSPPSAKIVTGDLAGSQTHVLVGTFDGNQMDLYHNGNLVTSKPLDREVALGDVILGADSDPSSVGQNLDGRICEMRLYYSAFDTDEVERITNAIGE